MLCNAREESRPETAPTAFLGKADQESADRQIFAFRQRITSASTTVDARRASNTAIQPPDERKSRANDPSAVRRANCFLSRQYQTLQRPSDAYKEAPMATYRPLSETSRDIHFTVHARGLELSDSHRRAIRRILASALGRFSRRVGTIRVWLEDVNGPRGGTDIRCRIEVDFRPRGSITVSALAIDEYTATARAAARARELVDRRVKKFRSRRRELVR
jgi:hypothetical protein